MMTPEQLLYIRLRSSSDVSSKTIIALLDHIDAQQARIDELEKDSARLNFIEKRHDMRLSTRSGKWWAFDKFSNYEQATYATLREAIDAAIDSVRQNPESV